MSFSSIDEVANAFGLEGLEPAEIRRRLRDRQAALHPDRHDGEFASSEDEAEFHRLAEAMAMLDAAGASMAMVPVDAIPQIVRAVREAMAPETRDGRQQILAEKLDAQVDRSVERYRAPLGASRLSITGLTAALTGMWAFPGVIAQNPVLSGFIDPTSRGFLTIWGCALLLTAGGWLLAWRQKDVHQSRMSALRSEPHQNRIFRSFMSEHVIDKEPRTFSKDDLVDFIRRPDRVYVPIILRMLSPPRSVDYEAAQTVADLMIGRLESRGIVEPLKSPSLSAMYRVIAVTD